MQVTGTGSFDLSSITTFLFDLDGVIWRGAAAIEGAAAAIRQLKNAGKRCLFCTNNSSRTTAYFVEKLRDMGIVANENDILTSSWVTAHYLSGHFTGPFLAYVIGEEGIRTNLQKIGARIVPDADLDGTQKVDCVVVGIDREFDYKKLSHAQRLIMNGALFIATNRDGSYPTENGVDPGGGSMVAAVETASGVTPVTVGKPRPVMIDLAMQKLNVKPGQVAMVGDRLDTDIACARRAGVTAICITTGVTTREKAEQARGELRPHFIFDDLASMCNVALTTTPAITTPLETASLPELVEEPVEADTSEPAEEIAAPNESAEVVEETAEDPEPFSTEGLPEKVESEEGDTSWTEDIDQLFEETEETAPEAAAPTETTAEADTPSENADEDAFDLDKALSVTQDEAPQPPPTQKPTESAPAADTFDWKLD